MDETLLGLMEIVGPIILLLLLIWLVVRSRKRHRGEPPKSVTERGTREVYAEEEQRRREGTDASE